MKKLSFFLIVFILMISVIESSYASTYYYTFSGTVNDGTIGSATLLIDITNNILTATLENTSPVVEGGERLDDPSQPGITGFGFDLNPASLGLSSWSLEAYTTSLILTTIGDSEIELTTEPQDPWIMDTVIAGVSLDYLPATSDNNIKGALYNPAAVFSDGLSASPNFFTTATLTMVFDQNISLVENFSTQGQNQPSPFVRMQAVGDGPDNSLKLPGTPTDIPNDIIPTGPQVPEPGTMILLGFGLISVAGIGRRKIKK